jgi:bacillithiol biosynthesis cysteine-adding enzyme BshC
METAVRTECYPVSVLPHQSRLFLDYVEGRESLSPFYPVAPFSGRSPLQPVQFSAEQSSATARLLASQAADWHSGPRAIENIERLKNGAAAVVTGQQVVLFGGPLLTLLKAATAIRLAKDATASGKPHIPIFWMATEDHDFDEVDHITFPSRHDLSRLQLKTHPAAASPVGSFVPGPAINEILDEAAAFLGGTAFYDALRESYAPGRTMAQSLGATIAHIFAPWGLVVIDAASREAHRLGAGVLRDAILRADELHAALTDRDRELKERGYHSQVMVAPQSSPLFLLDEESGARLLLRRIGQDWKSGSRTYSESELLTILDETPERISPNALLRPVFQDAILPTSAYVGGPAEIAYFAQSQVLYERLLGRTTPILPRLSATLVEPSVATVMARHEVTLPQVIAEGNVDELAQRLGARSMPVTGKQRLATAGNALDRELSELTTWMSAMDESLGRAAEVSASKMRYQMNRLRRLAANYQLQKDDSLRRHADALKLALFPDRHPQERLIGGAYYLARYGEEIAALLVDAADSSCPGHKAIWLS